MRTPRFLFFRGSTPTLELELPRELRDGDVVYLTFAQKGKRVLEYAINGRPSPAGTGSLIRSTEDGSLLLVGMSQADTLRLAAGDCELQLRVRSGDEAEVFPPIRGAVGQVRNQEVI